MSIQPYNSTQQSSNYDELFKTLSEDPMVELEAANETIKEQDKEIKNQKNQIFSLNNIVLNQVKTINSLTGRLSVLAQRPHDSPAQTTAQEILNLIQILEEQQTILKSELIKLTHPSPPAPNKPLDNIFSNSSLLAVARSDNQNIEDEYADADLMKYKGFAAFLEQQNPENPEEKPSEASQENSTNQDPEVTVHTADDVD